MGKSKLLQTMSAEVQNTSLRLLFWSVLKKLCTKIQPNLMEDIQTFPTNVAVTLRTIPSQFAPYVTGSAVVDDLLKDLFSRKHFFQA